MCVCEREEREREREREIVCVRRRRRRRRGSRRTALFSMDYHTLPRRQLQTLCKKHGIPANSTNLEMADALSALLKPKPDNTKQSEQRATRSREPEVSTTMSKGENLESSAIQVQTTVGSDNARPQRATRRRGCSKEASPSETDNSEPVELEGTSDVQKQRNKSVSTRRRVGNPGEDGLQAKLAENESTMVECPNSERKKDRAGGIVLRRGRVKVRSPSNFSKNSEFVKNLEAFEVNAEGNEAAQGNSGMPHAQIHRKNKRFVTFSDVLEVTHSFPSAETLTESDQGLVSPRDEKKVEVSRNGSRRASRKDGMQGLGTLRATQRKSRKVCGAEASNNLHSLPASEQSNRDSCGEIPIVSGTRQSRRSTLTASELNATQDNEMSTAVSGGEKVADSAVNGNLDTLAVSSARRSRRITLVASDVNTSQNKSKTSENLQEKSTACLEGSNPIATKETEEDSHADVSRRARRRTLAPLGLNHIQTNVKNTGKQLVKTSMMVESAKSEDHAHDLETENHAHEAVDSSANGDIDTVAVSSTRRSRRFTLVASAVNINQIKSKITEEKATDCHEGSNPLAPAGTEDDSHSRVSHRGRRKTLAPLDLTHKHMHAKDTGKQKVKTTMVVESTRGEDLEHLDLETKSHNSPQKDFQARTSVSISVSIEAEGNLIKPDKVHTSENKCPRKHTKSTDSDVLSSNSRKKTEKVSDRVVAQKTPGETWPGAAGPAKSTLSCGEAKAQEEAFQEKVGTTATPETVGLFSCSDGCEAEAQEEALQEKVGITATPEDIQETVGLFSCSNGPEDGGTHSCTLIQEDLSSLDKAAAESSKKSTSPASINMVNPEGNIYGDQLSKEIKEHAIESGIRTKPYIEISTTCPENMNFDQPGEQCIQDTSDVHVENSLTFVAEAVVKEGLSACSMKSPYREQIAPAHNLSSEQLISHKNERMGSLSTKDVEYNLNLCQEVNAIKEQELNFQHDFVDAFQVQNENGIVADVEPESIHEVEYNLPAKVKSENKENIHEVEYNLQAEVKTENKENVHEVEYNLPAEVKTENKENTGGHIADSLQVINKALQLDKVSTMIDSNTPDGQVGSLPPSCVSVSGTPPTMGVACETKQSMARAIYKSARKPKPSVLQNSKSFTKMGFDSSGNGGHLMSGEQNEDVRVQGYTIPDMGGDQIDFSSLEESEVQGYTTPDMCGDQVDSSSLEESEEGDSEDVEDSFADGEFHNSNTDMPYLNTDEDVSCSERDTCCDSEEDEYSEEEEDILSGDESYESEDVDINEELLSESEGNDSIDDNDGNESLDDHDFTRQPYSAAKLKSSQASDCTGCFLEDTQVHHNAAYEIALQDIEATQSITVACASCLIGKEVTLAQITNCTCSSDPLSTDHQLSKDGSLNGNGQHSIDASEGQTEFFKSVFALDMEQEDNSEEVVGVVQSSLEGLFSTCQAVKDGVYEALELTSEIACVKVTTEDAGTEIPNTSEEVFSEALNENLGAAMDYPITCTRMIQNGVAGYGLSSTGQAVNDGVYQALELNSEIDCVKVTTEDAGTKTPNTSEEVIPEALNEDLGAAMNHPITCVRMVPDGFAGDEQTENFLVVRGASESVSTLDMEQEDNSEVLGVIQRSLEGLTSTGQAVNDGVYQALELTSEIDCVIAITKDAGTETPNKSEVFSEALNEDLVAFLDHRITYTTMVQGGVAGDEQTADFPSVQAARLESATNGVQCDMIDSQYHLSTGDLLQDVSYDLEIASKNMSVCSSIAILALLDSGKEEPVSVNPKVFEPRTIVACAMVDKIDSNMGQAESQPVFVLSDFSDQSECMGEELGESDLQIFASEITECKASEVVHEIIMNESQIQDCENRIMNEAVAVHYQAMPQTPSAHAEVEVDEPIDIPQTPSTDAEVEGDEPIVMNESQTEDCGNGIMNEPEAVRCQEIPQTPRADAEIEFKRCHANERLEYVSNETQICTSCFTDEMKTLTCQEISETQSIVAEGEPMSAPMDELPATVLNKAQACENHLFEETKEAPTASIPTMESQTQNCENRIMNEAVAVHCQEMSQTLSADAEVEVDEPIEIPQTWSADAEDEVAEPTVMNESQTKNCGNGITNESEAVHCQEIPQTPSADAEIEFKSDHVNEHLEYVSNETQICASCFTEEMKTLKCQEILETQSIVAGGQPMSAPMDELLATVLNQALACENHLSEESKEAATASIPTMEISKEQSLKQFELTLTSLRKLKKMCKESDLPATTKPQAATPSRRPIDARMSTKKGNTSVQPRDIPSANKRSALKALSSNIKSLTPAAAARTPTAKSMQTPRNLMSIYDKNEGAGKNVVGPSSQAPQSSRKEIARQIR